MTKPLKTLFGLGLFIVAFGLTPDRLGAWLELPSWWMTTHYRVAVQIVRTLILASGLSFLSTSPPLWLRWTPKATTVLASLFAGIFLWKTLAGPLLPFLPKKLKNFTLRPHRILLQGSKAPGVPKNYVALLGDSNAAGLGDWCIQEEAKFNSRCHSPHLLQKGFGKDVLSFGVSGRSNLGAINREFLVNYTLLRKHYNLPPPDEFLIYFYEGNDLLDNLAEVYRLNEKSLGDNPTYEKYIGYVQRHLLQMKAHEIDGQRYLPWTLLESAWLELNDRQVKTFFVDRTFKKPEPKSGKYNRARFVSGTRSLPDRLQGPMMQMTEPEVQRGAKLFEYSVRFLQSQFPKTPISIVYLPSPLSQYDVSGKTHVRLWTNEHLVPELSAYRKLKNHTLSQVYDVSDIRKRAQLVSSTIKEISRKNGWNWIDPSAALRVAARTHPLHGPLDWEHFNRIGYETLASAILSKHALNRQDSSPS